MFSDAKKNEGVLLTIKFILYFLLLYGFNYAFVGLTAPGGRLYFSFADEYVNYVKWLRSGLLNTTSSLLQFLLGIETIQARNIALTIDGRVIVRLVYSCLALGIISFWTAFILAQKDAWKRKLKWIILGIIIICIVNILRISLVAYATYFKSKDIFLGLDHHSFFNIIAYSVVFLLMYLYIKRTRIKPNSSG